MLKIQEIKILKNPTDIQVEIFKVLWIPPHSHGQSEVALLDSVAPRFPRLPCSIYTCGFYGARRI